VASANFGRAGLAGMIDLRVGKAIETLPKIAAENHGPFDLVFIDADKPSTADYFKWALELTAPGSVIIVDNVIRNGAIIEADSKDPGVIGVRRFNDVLKTEKRVDATAVQTVGSKGYDGFTMAMVV
jgi:predicted O-methyltransferase YrrM